MGNTKYSTLTRDKTIDPHKKTYKNRKSSGWKWQGEAGWVLVKYENIGVA